MYSDRYDKPFKYTKLLKFRDSAFYIYTLIKQGFMKLMK